jgi:hypothetical protein
MTSEFNKWWDEDDLTTQGNNFVDGTPAYWAWEGWCAAVKVEREACAKVCDVTKARIWEFHPYAVREAAHSVCANLAAAIRARTVGQA